MFQKTGTWSPERGPHRHMPNSQPNSPGTSTAPPPLGSRPGQDKKEGGLGPLTCSSAHTWPTLTGSLARAAGLKRFRHLPRSLWRSRDGQRRLLPPTVGTTSPWKARPGPPPPAPPACRNQVRAFTHHPGDWTWPLESQLPCAAQGPRAGWDSCTLGCSRQGPHLWNLQRPQSLSFSLMEG